MKTRLLFLALAFAASPLGAQDSAHVTAATALDSAAAHAAQVTAAEVQQGSATAEGHGAAVESACGAHDPSDIITPHITDSHCIEYPGFPKFWEPREAELPRWAPIHVGGTTIDLSPTKHVVMLLIAALLCCIILIGAARAHVRHTHAVGRPKGFAAGIEAMVLYIRQEVALPNLGHHGEGYAPFICALFFFILIANLLGLIPFGSTATGNVSVTATLAIVTFIVVETAGMRAQGLGYLNSIFYWNKELPLVMRVPMFVLMSPIEVVGKLTKPFALTIRLFANMTAGHIVVLALIGLIFVFKSYVLGTAPLLMAVAIMMLELFVAFLQAFIFSLLASVFIGQIREAHH
ncbi:MAG TPA: F0F1 ATP synthase subunit A [Gemmatimonadaceae bacterium]|nr:F0F1 ATP synthase subunit A [Gemmatimonadaceae bacterium]